jgi:hypothetical protein
MKIDDEQELQLIAEASVPVAMTLRSNRQLHRMKNFRLQLQVGLQINGPNRNI